MNNQAIDFNYNLNIDQATEIIGSYYKGYFSSIACRKHIIDWFLLIDMNKILKDKTCSNITGNTNVPGDLVHHFHL